MGPETGVKVFQELMEMWQAGFIAAVQGFCLPSLCFKSRDPKTNSSAGQMTLRYPAVTLV